MGELQIVDIRRVAAFGDRNNVVDAWRHRMWKPDMKIDFLSADAADGLCGEDFALVGFKLRTLRAVVIRAQIGFRLVSGHGVLLSGHEKSTLQSECCVIFKKRTGVVRSTL